MICLEIDLKETRIIFIIDKHFYIVLDPVELARNGNTTFLDQWNSDWNHIAPISFQYEKNTSRTDYISKELKKFYINNHVTLDNIDGIGKVSMQFLHLAVFYIFIIFDFCEFLHLIFL